MDEKMFEKCVHGKFSKQKLRIKTREIFLKVEQLMKMLREVNDYKQLKDHEMVSDRAAKHKIELEKIEAKHQRKTKDVKKRICRTLNLLEKKRVRASLGMTKKKSRK